MLFLQLFLAAFGGCGVYMILADFAVFPSRRVEKLYQTGGGNSKESILDRLCGRVAQKIEPHLTTTGYKKEKLEHTLRTIGDGRSAARYTADAISQGLLVGAVGLALVFLHPLLPLVFLPVAYFAYRQIMKEPEKKLTVKRERIEKELARFSSTISNSLTVSRDVVKILENYRRVCGPELAEELDVTLADMKTGNAQDALRGLENRIGSTKLSELVRGLLSVLQGEDQAVYFLTKNAEFQRDYIERQKQEIQKRPDKLLPNIFGIVGIYLIMLFYILGYQVVSGQNKIF